MNHKKSLAIVGIGRWGKNLLREFNKISRVEFCYYRGALETKKWLAANYPHIKTAGSYNELLTNPTIDAIVIATPIKTHYELARRALIAGKHVFVEKPMTASVKQAQELVRLAAKNKRVFFVGHIFSYHPVLTKIKSILRKERFQYATILWLKFGTFNEELIFNLLSHEIATALDLFGKPTGFKIFGKREDVINLELDFQDKRFCTIQINRVSNLKNKIMTIATDKNIYYWGDKQLLKLDKKTNSYKLIYENTKAPLEIECAEFIRCIEQNKKPHTNGEFGIEVVKLLSKI